MITQTSNRPLFQRPLWVALFALTASIAWGWAYPLIKLGFAEFQITPDMTGSKMLFAGVRFSMAGLIVLMLAKSSRREMQLKEKAKALTRFSGLNVVTLLGGVDFEKQKAQLDANFVDIIV